LIPKSRAKWEGRRTELGLGVSRCPAQAAHHIIIILMLNLARHPLLRSSQISHPLMLMCSTLPDDDDDDDDDDDGNVD